MIKRLLQPLLFLLLLPSVAWSAIALTGSCTGSVSCTISSGVAAGDIIFAFAFRDGNNTAPTIPGGWTTISSGAGTNSNGAAWVWRVAVGTSEASGTFSSATSLIMVSFSGANTSSIGGAPGDSEGATNSTVLYPDADTFTTGDGTSWVIACAGTRSANTNIESTTPTGLSATGLVFVEDGTDAAACYSSNGGKSSYAGDTVNIGGTNSGWRGKSAEILVAAAGSAVPALLQGGGF